MSDTTSIFTDGADVTIETTWLRQDGKEPTRLLVVRTDKHEVTFFMKEDCKVLLVNDQEFLLCWASASWPSFVYERKKQMTYEEFEKECNRQLTNIAGLGIHDLADASWRDYFDAGMSPRDAIECANDDYWDGELSVILHG